MRDSGYMFHSLIIHFMVPSSIHKFRDPLWPDSFCRQSNLKHSIFQDLPEFYSNFMTEFLTVCSIMKSNADFPKSLEEQ